MPYSRVSFRMTLSDLEWLAKYSVTRSIAWRLCDSWATCLLISLTNEQSYEQWNTHHLKQYPTGRFSTLINKMRNIFCTCSEVNLKHELYCPYGNDSTLTGNSRQRSLASAPRGRRRRAGVVKGFSRHQSAQSIVLHGRLYVDGRPASWEQLNDGHQGDLWLTDVSRTWCPTTLIYRRLVVTENQATVYHRIW